MAHPGEEREEEDMVSDLEEESFVTAFSRNREDDPRLMDQAISSQKELIDSIRHSVIETPDLLAFIEDLLTSGVDALAPDYNLCLYNSLGDVCPPLHIAVLRNLPKVTELLLKYKGHPNVAGRDGWTAAHLAAETGSAECLKVLIEFGADVNATTQAVTPTDWDQKPQTEDLAILRALGLWARYHGSEEANSTPLHLAAQGAHLECVRLLLDHGANVNAVNINQNTPLFLASKTKILHFGTMKLNQRNTPITDRRCLYKQMKACINKLVHRGADVGHPNRYDETVFNKAVLRRWDMDMMKLLILEGHGVDLDRAERGYPLRTLMRWQIWRYNSKDESSRFLYSDVQENTTLLFLRMGATRRDLKQLLWLELNLPKQSGVLLQTLMDSFSYLPSLSELDSENGSRPAIVEFRRYYSHPITRENGWVCSGTLWHRLEAGMTEEARTQEEDRLKAIVAKKKRHYHQRSREVPSLLHLSRAAIRSNLQADVRKVITWPVPEWYKRYILLDHDL